ncbi:MAG: hypothetical protein WAO20_05705 [Acidobacteriota bacterium]
MRLVIGFVLLSLLSAPNEEAPTPARLSARLELMRQGGVFLESTDDALEVYAGGWKVQRIPARILEISRGKSVAAGQVRELVPLVPVPAVIIDSEEVAADAGDTNADVSTLDQIIGVDKMPDSYLVYFDDGSIWIVNPGSWFGISRIWRKGKLQFQVARQLADQVIGRDGLRLSFLTMDEASARHLYWILEEGLPVLQ